MKILLISVEMGEGANLIFSEGANFSSGAHSPPCQAPSLQSAYKQIGENFKWIGANWAI